MYALLVDQPDELAGLVDRFVSCASIGLDVEGDGLFRYRARLCTIQISSSDEIAVVDALALDDLSPLSRLLGDAGPEKIVHDASFDARLLRDRGVPLGNLFDTSVAARFRGEKSTGLAALLQSRFGVTLPKEQQNADWGRRPLDEQMIAYLVDDVRWLLPLGAKLREEIRAAGIEAEVEEECAYVLYNAATDTPDERPAWARIKGVQDLPPPALSVLREIAEVREEAARRFDLPPFKVLTNEVLLEIAARRPASVAALFDVPGFGRGRSRALSTDLLQAIRAGTERDRLPEDEMQWIRREMPPREEREQRRRRHQALGRWRGALAEQRGVDPQVVLPGHCLQDLAARGALTLDELRAIPGLGEVRIARDGEAILDALRSAG